MNAREVTEADGYHAANPRRRVPGQSHALQLYPSPIWVVQRSGNERSTHRGFVVRSKPKRNCVAIKWCDFFVLHGVVSVHLRSTSAIGVLHCRHGDGQATTASS